MYIYIVGLTENQLGEYSQKLVDFTKTDKYKKKIKTNQDYADAFQSVKSNVIAQLDKAADIPIIFLAIPSSKQVMSFETDPTEALSYIEKLKPTMWTGKIAVVHDVTYIGFSGLGKIIENLAILKVLDSKAVPYDLWHQPTFEIDPVAYADVVQLIHKELTEAQGGHIAEIMEDLEILYGLDAAWDLKTLLALSNRLGIRET